MKNDRFIMIVIIVNIIFFTILIISFIDNPNDKSIAESLSTNEKEGRKNCISVLDTNIKGTSIKDVNLLEINFKNGIVTDYSLNYHLSYDNTQDRNDFSTIRDIYTRTIRSYRNIKSAKVIDYVFEGNILKFKIEHVLTEDDIDTPLLHYGQTISDALVVANFKGYECK